MNTSRTLQIPRSYSVLDRIWCAGGSRNTSRALQIQRFCVVLHRNGGTDWKYNDISVSSTFEPLEVPWIHPEHYKCDDIVVFCFVLEALEIPDHCKYNEIQLFCIIFEALQVAWKRPEHCKYNDIIAFRLVFETLEVPWILPEQRKYHHILVSRIVFWALEELTKLRFRTTFSSPYLAN